MCPLHLPRQVARQVDEKKKAKAGLDMWREKTGKEPQLEVERQRKVQEKAITKKRNAQRREADALYPSADEEEEEMIAEMEALEARVGLLQQDLEANRRWNLAAQQVLQKVRCMLNVTLFVHCTTRLQSRLCSPELL